MGETVYMGGANSKKKGESSYQKKNQTAVQAGEKKVNKYLK